MTITYHRDLVQGTEEWFALRRGKLTASTMRCLLTDTTHRQAKGDARRTLMYELLAQRVTGHVETSYTNDHMIRGGIDEAAALAVYSEHFAPVDRCGYIENDEWGFPIGYSPDGLVGDDGLVEVKSHIPRLQIESLLSGTTPLEFVVQLQVGLMVSGREWIDFISYCGGLPMQVIRVMHHPILQRKIESAAETFEADLECLIDSYRARVEGMIMTERREYGEMI